MARPRSTRLTRAALHLAALRPPVVPDPCGHLIQASCDFSISRAYVHRLCPTFDSPSELDVPTRACRRPGACRSSSSPPGCSAAARSGIVERPVAPRAALRSPPTRRRRGRRSTRIREDLLPRLVGGTRSEAERMALVRSFDRRPGRPPDLPRLLTRCCHRRRSLRCSTAGRPARIRAIQARLALAASVASSPTPINVLIDDVISCVIRKGSTSSARSSSTSRPGHASPWRVARSRPCRSPDGVPKGRSSISGSPNSGSMPRRRERLWLRRDGPAG